MKRLMAILAAVLLLPGLALADGGTLWDMWANVTGYWERCVFQQFMDEAERHGHPLPCSWDELPEAFLTEPEVPAYTWEVREDGLLYVSFEGRPVNVRVSFDRTSDDQYWMEDLGNGVFRSHRSAPSVLNRVTLTVGWPWRSAGRIDYSDQQEVYLTSPDQVMYMHEEYPGDGCLMTLYVWLQDRYATFTQTDDPMNDCFAALNFDAKTKELTSVQFKTSAAEEQLIHACNVIWENGAVSIIETIVQDGTEHEMWLNSDGTVDFYPFDAASRDVFAAYYGDLDMATLDRYELPRCFRESVGWDN